MNPPIIMDIEASGFGHSSYPIEIGFAGPESQRYCALIKPCKSWEHWDDHAEQVHGITRDLLHENGTEAKDVALALNELLAGKTVYSDGWVVDLPWLRKLFYDVGIEPQFTLSPIESILSEAQLPFWEDATDSTRASHPLQRHRASNDAFLVQQTFLLSKRMAESSRRHTASGSA